MLNKKKDLINNHIDRDIIDLQLILKDFHLMQQNPDYMDVLSQYDIQFKSFGNELIHLANTIKQIQKEAKKEVVND